MSARVILTDGAQREVPARAVESLYDALDAWTARRGPLDVEEGAWLDPAIGTRPGGRTEFERARQRWIAEWLRRHEVPGAPRVMIIGDAIRMHVASATGYYRHAYQALLGKANLLHVAYNCGGTLTALQLMASWLSLRPDIVHYNAGLHDLATLRRGSGRPPLGTDLDTYRANLERIFTAFSAGGVRKVIWALTTPVDDEWHARSTRVTGARRLTRTRARVRTYNDASIAVAQVRGAAVHDLYTPLSEAGVRSVLRPDGVHLNSTGAALAGKRVAEAIEKWL